MFTTNFVFGRNDYANNANPVADNRRCSMKRGAFFLPENGAKIRHRQEKKNTKYTFVRAGAE